MSRERPRFEVLVVCTGNICRSPMGELLLRDGLARRVDVAHSDAFVVTSAGTYPGHAGEPMQPGAARALSELGIDPDGFTATTLTEQAVADADLVVTAERAHRAEVVRMHPAATLRAFTIRELARLATAVDPAELDAQAGIDPVDRAHALVRQAGALRGTHPPTRPTADDVEDPYGLPLAEFRACAEQIRLALEPVLDRITGG